MNENDPLGFTKQKTIEDDMSNYGIEDEYLNFVRQRVIEAKQKKGRGILISFHKFNE